ncbi:MAG TPA: peptidoglycan-binding protein [Acetobacteraceae bacterium]
MVDLSADILRQIAPRQSGSRATGQAAIINAIGPVIQAICGNYAINTGLRDAHFLAQVCCESDGFCTTVEYASGDAYNGRADLGNTQPGDGPRFKGRGLIQLTGRSNYRQYGDLLKLDLVGDPEQAADPVISLRIACTFWQQHLLNPLADADDIIAITRRINGGLNGLDTRRAYLAAAKFALGVRTAIADMPILRVGGSGAPVVRMQNLLATRGYGLTADGAFGPATAEAVKQFQASEGLPADGVVGPATWEALEADSSE